MREKLGHRTRGAKTQQNSPGAWHYSPLPEGVSSHRGTTEGGGNGWELRRRLRRRTNTREGAGWQRPGRWRRREEPGKRQEGPGAGGAQLDPGHSHDDGPRWSWRREEPWRSDCRQLQGADQRRRSRWWRSPRRRRRANEPGGCRGSGGPGWSRGLWRPRRRWRSGDPRRSRSDWGPRWSWREEGAQRSRWDGATRRSRRRGVLRRWRVDGQPRRSRRDEGARWSWRIDGWRWRDTPAPATLEDGRPTGLAPYKQGAEGERRGCQTTAVEEAGAGGRAVIFEERALEDLTPPPCPAHPQPRCRGRSSTPRSHRPRLAPSWWALSPALAPGLTGWAQLPGRSSAQSLGLALARRSRREMALRHRWAWAGAPWAGLWVRSGSGEIIHGADGEGRSITRQSPLHEGGEILSRTIFGRQRYSGSHHRMSRARRPGSWWR